MARFGMVPLLLSQHFTLGRASWRNRKRQPGRHHIMPNSAWFPRRFQAAIRRSAAVAGAPLHSGQVGREPSGRASHQAALVMTMGGRPTLRQRRGVAASSPVQHPLHSAGEQIPCRQIGLGGDAEIGTVDAPMIVAHCCRFWNASQALLRPGGGCYVHQSAEGVAPALKLGNQPFGTRCRHRCVSPAISHRVRAVGGGAAPWQRRRSVLPGAPYRPAAAGRWTRWHPSSCPVQPPPALLRRAAGMAAFGSIAALRWLPLSGRNQDADHRRPSLCQR